MDTKLQKDTTQLHLYCIYTTNMVSTAAGGWAPAPAGPTVTLAGTGGLGLAGAGLGRRPLEPWLYQRRSSADRPSESFRRLGRLGPGRAAARRPWPHCRLQLVCGHWRHSESQSCHGADAACQAGPAAAPPLSPQPGPRRVADSAGLSPPPGRRSLALAAGLPELPESGPAAAGNHRAKSDNPGDDDP